MRCQHIGTHQSEFRQSPHGSHTVLSFTLLDFVTSLMQMQVNVSAQLVGIGQQLAEDPIIDGIRRVRRQTRGNTGMSAQGVARRKSLVQVVVCICGVGRREIQHYQTERSTHAGEDDRVGRSLREIIHVVKSRYATFKHFGACQ